MISKACIKLIKSLEIRKNRVEKQLFVAESPKLVNDLLSIFQAKIIVALPSWIEKNKHVNAENIFSVTEEELKKTSLQQHPQQVIAVFEMPKQQTVDYNFVEKMCETDLIIALDAVQDPGNVGTIIRICDWFGIKNIICNDKTADIYAPKVVQSTMGSMARVNVFRCELETIIQKLTTKTPIYATVLNNATNIYEQKLTNKGIVIMGNEGNGISNEILQYVNKKLFIPRYPAENCGAESLNVGMATAIICAEFRRVAKK